MNSQQPVHAYPHNGRAEPTGYGIPYPPQPQPQQSSRRRANAWGLVLCLTGLVSSVLCALAYAGVISLESRYTVPGILLAIGATALLGGLLALFVRGRDGR